MQTQSLGVISVNLWDVLISLANLGLLYWLFKRFLFDRVRKVLDQRQAALDKQYADAAQAQQQAEKDQAAWAAEEAKRLLPRPDREAVISLDQAYISRNLSPGGCADLLAVSYFLLDWRQDAAKSSCKQTSLE